MYLQEVLIILKIGEKIPRAKASFSVTFIIPFVKTFVQFEDEMQVGQEAECLVFQSMYRGCHCSTRVLG